MFQRLSVFAGGWTLEAAEAVCADDGRVEADVLDLLTQLVEKSLVVMEVSGERYRMLDTVRHYAQEKLAGVRRRRCRARAASRFLLGTCRKSATGAAGPEQGAWLTRLDHEHENFLTAHAWSDKSANAGEVGSAHGSRTASYWINRGLLGLGLSSHGSALTRPGLQDRTMRAAAHWQMRARSASSWDATPKRRTSAESLSIAREVNDVECSGGCTAAARHGVLAARRSR